MDLNDDFYQISVILPNDPNRHSLLRVPIQDVYKYSSTPLKWLRYCAGVILGTEGNLQSISIDPDNRVTYSDVDYSDEDPNHRSFVFTASGVIHSTQGVSTIYSPLSSQLKVATISPTG
jgi:hypothetical protein